MNTMYKSPTFTSDSKQKVDSTFTVLSQMSSEWVSSENSISATHGLTIGPSNTATFYLTDSAVVWDDLVMPLQSGRTGGVAPIFAQWGGGGLYVYKFDNNDELQFSFQLPHTWKCGTEIYPHLHWCQDAATASPNAGLSAVRWNLEFSWAGIPNGEYTPSNTTTVWTTANVLGPNTQILTNIPTSGINPTTVNHTASSISSVFVCRLFRGGTGDTYGATRIVGLSFDIHYQVDSLGSEDITHKYI